YSQGDGYDRNRAAQRNAIDLDFSFDVFYHTSVSDPRCMAVVEVILLERMLDGVVRGQYSMGWALLPLFRVGVGAAGSLGGDVTLDALGSGKPLSVPLVGGTPRYLLLRHVYNEELRAPKVLPNCSITFQTQPGPSGPLHYSIRVGVHNGRTFVGPSYELVNVTCMDVPGWKVLQGTGQWTAKAWE
ncbi:uncharacterized protein HaLaN_03636, partial [Haematococcus lacustris]